MMLKRLCIVLWLLPFLWHVPAKAEPGVNLCNGSATTPIFVAKAWQKGYAGNYVASGWYELRPAAIRLFRHCTTLGVGFTSPVYVAIVHDDPAGRRSLYNYEFETYGGIFQADQKWLCASLTGHFQLDGSSLQDLANCPTGMPRIPFSMRINPPGDNDDITLYIADPANPGTPLVSLEEITRGTATSVAWHEEAGTYGVAKGYLTHRDAEQAALAACQQSAGRAGCTVALTTRGHCVAIGRAAGSKRLWVNIGNDAETARKRAVEACGRVHGNCRIEEEHCPRLIREAARRNRRRSTRQAARRRRQ
jgi:Domain of unknown function (DUF4189)